MKEKEIVEFETVPVQLKVHGIDREVDCEYRSINRQYHLFLVESKYGDVELDMYNMSFKYKDRNTVIGIYNPVGIKQLRKKYNLEHKNKVVISDKELDVFKGLKL